MSRDTQESVSEHDSSDAARGSTRRRVLFGTAGAGALLGAGAVGWWVGTRNPEVPPGPSPQESCVSERALPETFPTELEEADAVALARTDLGMPFRTVSLQDVARMPSMGGPARLLITQSGASAQIQFVALDGSEEPIVLDSEFGVNPGVAISEDGTSFFVTREEGRVLSVDASLSGLRDLGRVGEEVTSLYSPVIGSGGTVFGGSYPIGAVWALEPSSGAIRVGPRIGTNQYVRTLVATGERIFAGTGGDQPLLFELDLESLEAVETFQVPGIREGGSVSRLDRLTDGTLLVYRDEEDGGSDGIIFDPRTGEFGVELSPGAASRSMARVDDDGTMTYVADTRIMAWTPGEGETADIGLSPIANPRAVIALEDGSVIAVAADPESTSALTIAVLNQGEEARTLEIAASGHDITAVIAMPSTGHLAIGGYQADGVVVISPEDESIARSPRATGIQQVEGGIENGEGSMLLGSYGEGRIHEAVLVEGSEALEVQQIANLGAEYQQARPITWAPFGDGFVVGTVPEQGRRGGLIQTFLPDGEGWSPADVVEDPAEGLSIVGAVEPAEGELIITTSVLGGYGAASEATASHIMRLGVPGGDVLWDTIVPFPDSYTPILQQDRLFCATTSGLLILSADSGELLATYEIGEAAEGGGYSSARIEPWRLQGRFLHVARGQLSVLDVVDGTVSRGTDGVGSPLTVLDGRVFAASGATLQQFVLPDSPDATDCST